MDRADLRTWLRAFCAESHPGKGSWSALVPSLLNPCRSVRSVSSVFYSSGFSLRSLRLCGEISPDSLRVHDFAGAEARFVVHARAAGDVEAEIGPRFLQLPGQFDGVEHAKGAQTAPG